MTVHDYKLVCPNYSLFKSGTICEECKGNKYYNAIRYKCLKGSYLKSVLACLEMYFCKLSKIYENNIGLFIVPSRFMRQKIIDFGINPEKIYYLPHAVNLDRFKPNFELGKYIFYFGSLTHKKGIENFLKSVKYLPKNTPVKIAGDGLLREKLNIFLDQEGLTNVEFLGPKTRQELSGLIQNSFFTVMPSIWPEPVGLTIYESFACGKCVIGADSGGIPELINDGFNGLLFNPDSPKELADKIVYLLDNPGKAIELGKNAFEKIKRLNDRPRHYQELLGIYQEQINKSLN